MATKLFSKIKYLQILVAFVLAFGSIFPTGTVVLAEDTVPPPAQEEVSPADPVAPAEPQEPAAEASVEPPAGDIPVDATVEDTVVEATVDPLLPVATVEPLATPPPMVVAPVTETTVEEILQAAEDNGVTLADASGEPLTLVSAESEELLTTGDPFFFDGTKWVGYTVDGTGCPSNVECHAQIAGMGTFETAVSLAPSGSTIYVASGTYAEDVTINTTNLSFVAFNSIVVPDANVLSDLQTVSGFTTGFAIVDTLRLYKDFGTTNGVFANNIFVYGENSTGSDGIAPSYGPVNTNSGRLSDALNLVNVSNVNATIEANLQLNSDGSGYYNIWDFNDHSTNFEWDCGEPLVYIQTGVNYRMVLKNPFNPDVLGYYTSNPDERPLNLTAQQRMEDLILGATMSEQTVNGWTPWGWQDEQIVYWNLLGHVNGVPGLSSHQQDLANYITAGTNDGSIVKNYSFWWLWPIADSNGHSRGSLSPLNTQFTFLKYPTPTVNGCSDPSANNYNPNATGEGDCDYPPRCEWDEGLTADDPNCHPPVRCEWDANLSPNDPDCQPPVFPTPPPPVVVGTGGFIPITGTRIIVAGLGHTCMTEASGTVVCWGLNASGQDGEGTFTNQLVPAFVKNLSGVVDLTAGSLHTCALRGEGDVWCWGDNTYGQLGDGTTVNRNTPILVKGLPGKVISFTGGQDFTCAKVESGEVYCWGRNDAGQLNDGTSTNRFTPVKSNLEKELTAMSGGQTVLVGESTGKVDEWSETKPAKVNDISLSLGISGNRFAPGGCAVTANGVVNCWGQDLNSVPIDRATSAIEVAAGMTHNCSVNIDSTVSCWGSNSYGELGDGTNNPNPAAVRVKDLAEVGDLAVGAHHSCVLMSDGYSAQCWGWNTYGQLGNNSTGDSSLPVRVYPPVR